MEDAIYLIQPDESLVEMHATPYESEPLLQGMLAKYPHLLAGGQMDEANPRRWLLIGREMGIAWEEGGGDQLSLDHLFVDQDGIPTLVEVKRSSDTRIRREVVGQMLEYAANAVSYWPIEKLRLRFEARCQAEGLEAEQLIIDFLADADSDEPDPEQFWQQVQANLQAGRIRLVFVADEIPPQLRRIVEFLNQQMTPAEVLAVEVRQYVGQELRTLVPRLIGQTAQAQQRKSGGSVQYEPWDEARFFADLARRGGQAEVDAARRILDWAKTHMPDIYWGRGKKDGSFTPGLTYEGQWHQLIGVWTNRYVELQFQYMKSRGTLSDAQRLALLKRINQTAGAALPDESIHRRPSIPLATFTKPGVLDAFLKDLEWALDQFKDKSPATRHGLTDS